MPKVKDWVTNATKSWHLYARALAWEYTKGSASFFAELVAAGDVTDALLDELIERAGELGDYEPPSLEDRDEVFAWIKPVGEFILECRQRWPLSDEDEGDDWCAEAKDALAEYMRPTFAALGWEGEFLHECIDYNDWPATLTEEGQKRMVNSGVGG
jgi:hypothetical protein